jgi:hypothetical protein
VDDLKLCSLLLRIIVGSARLLRISSCQQSLPLSPSCCMIPKKGKATRRHNACVLLLSEFSPMGEVRDCKVNFLSQWNPNLLLFVPSIVALFDTSVFPNLQTFYFLLSYFTTHKSFIPRQENKTSRTFLSFSSALPAIFTLGPSNLY